MDPQNLDLILPYLGKCKQCGKEFAYVGQTNPAPEKCGKCDPEPFLEMVYNYRPDWEKP